MGDSIKARAPMRISFGGGGTDVPPFCEEYGGCVLNSAIAKYAYVTLSYRTEGIMLKSLDHILGVQYNQKHDLIQDESIKYNMAKAAIKHYLQDDKGVEISFFLDVIYQSGLGSSSAAFVALIRALDTGEKLGLTKKKVAEEAWRLEREELGNIGGKQDQYASAFGGLNFIEFSADRVDINPLRVDDKTALDLENQTLLFHYKPRSSSGSVLENQIRNVKEKKKETIDALLRSKEVAKEMKKKLLDGDVNGIGELLDEAWKQKKKFSSTISNPDLDKLYQNLKAKGALGGKISGAGGGGYMYVMCEENKTIDVYHYLTQAGFQPSFLKIDLRGVVTWI
ncbi:GHMP kinase [Candidatus Micrarchaeota archaeon]|nr:GHMP kinase [Candidatus Micrarchaeota archaeon]